MSKKSVQSFTTDTSTVNCAWLEEDGRQILWFEAVAPQVDDQVWTLCLSKFLSGYDGEELRVLSDVRRTTEAGNSTLYAEIVRELIANGIKSVKLAMVTKDAGRKYLLQLLQTIAEEQGVEAEVEVFFILEDAQNWVSR